MSKERGFIWFAALESTIVGFGMVSPARASLGEPLQEAPTGWSWYVGQTPAQVSTLISSKNARLVSLRVQSSSPLLFDVATVQNTGTYKKDWWWYYGFTAEELQNYYTAKDARLVSVEPYVVGGTTYFAAIMLHNVGADYSSWWWYYGLTPAQIQTNLTANKARLIDLRQYASGGSIVYGVVMVPNTGANHSGWWWYYGITPAQIQTNLTTNKAYLISIDPADSSGSTFNVVMNAAPSGLGWWWYYGETVANAESLAVSNKARIFDVKSYVVGGTQNVAVLMFANTWNSTQSAEGSCDKGVISGWHSMAPAVGLGSTSSTTSYDSVITSLMKKYQVPGGAVAVINNGKLVLARGYGLSDTGNTLIAHPDSLFRIASLSKQITSAVVLTLVQNGKLSLTDKPFTLLGFTPDPSKPETAALAKITIQELLHHTGGWSRETGCTNCSTEGDPMFESETIAAAQSIPSPPDCDHIIQYMLSQPVYWTPGKVYDYSNFGYCVLGAVIEKVTGKSYASYAATSVLGPSGANRHRAGPNHLGRRPRGRVLRLPRFRFGTGRVRNQPGRLHQSLWQLLSRSYGRPWRVGCLPRRPFALSGSSRWPQRRHTVTQFDLHHRYDFESGCSLVRDQRLQCAHHLYAVRRMVWHGLGSEFGWQLVAHRQPPRDRHRAGSRVERLWLGGVFQFPSELRSVLYGPRQRSLDRV